MVSCNSMSPEKRGEESPKTTLLAEEDHSRMQVVPRGELRVRPIQDALPWPCLPGACSMDAMDASIAHTSKPAANVQHFYGKRHGRCVAQQTGPSSQQHTDVNHADRVLLLYPYQPHIQPSLLFFTSNEGLAKPRVSHASASPHTAGISLRFPQPTLTKLSPQAPAGEATLCVLRGHLSMPFLDREKQTTTTVPRAHLPPPSLFGMLRGKKE